MRRIMIFGLGYTASVLAARLGAAGWAVRATGRTGCLDFADRAGVEATLDWATHVLSSVPPEASGSDPVLAAYGRKVGRVPWVGYLSSTGVYGDTRGAWVDETAPLGGGRRSARVAADLAWQALGEQVRVFRLPGIYGPGRSPIDRVRSGTAQRVDAPGQVFSRVHVEDIALGIEASFEGPPGVYNLADDEPAPQNSVVDEACRLLGFEPPPLTNLADASLSPAARAFYSENRRIANGKARRALGWRPRWPSYREGLRGLLDEGMALPPAAIGNRR